MRRDGFTLIEIAVVLAIGAVLTLSAAVCLRSPFQSARFENTVDRLVGFDRRVRDHARRFDRPVDLVVDLDAGSLAIVAPGTHGVLQPVLISRVAGMDCLAIGGNRLHAGAMTIPISGRGCSVTYALRLRGSAAQSVWLVVAGITGQVVRTEREDDVTSLLTFTESPAAARADAR